MPRLMEGQDLNQLRETIAETFSPQEFEEFYRIRLNKNLYREVGRGEKYDHQIFTVLDAYDRKKKPMLVLLQALAAEIPDEEFVKNLLLKYQVGFGAYLDDQVGQPLNANALQTVIRDNPYIKLEPFANWILETKKCICRIEIEVNGYTAYGTGFLIQPDLVLTNYHVVKKLIVGEIDVNKIKCRFDYTYTASGADISLGNLFELHQDLPVLAYSEYTNFDVTPPLALDDVEWPADKLDYAVVRLAKPVGDMDFGPNAKGIKHNKRGWIKKPSDNVSLEAQSHIFMIQHPMDEPQQIAIGLKKVIGTDRNVRRVRYGISTKKGSSGSPGFDINFQWSCLHNCGDPDFNATYNQGIPSNRIIDDLKSKGINL